MAHPLGRTKAESQTLGALTKIALWFDLSAGEKTFTGHEVAGILLSAWQGYEQSKRTTLLPEETEP